MRYIQYRPDILVTTASLSIKWWEAVPKLTNDCPWPGPPLFVAYIREEPLLSDMCQGYSV